MNGKQSAFHRLLPLRFTDEEECCDGGCFAGGCRELKEKIEKQFAFKKHLSPSSTDEELEDNNSCFSGGCRRLKGQIKEKFASKKLLSLCFTEEKLHFNDSCFADGCRGLKGHIHKPLAIKRLLSLCLTEEELEGNDSCFAGGSRWLKRHFQKSFSYPMFPQDRVRRFLRKKGERDDSVLAEGLFLHLSTAGLPMKQVFLAFTLTDLIILNQDIGDPYAIIRYWDEAFLSGISVDQYLPLSQIRFFVLDDRARRFTLCTCFGDVMHYEMCQLDFGAEEQWNRWISLLHGLAGGDEFDKLYGSKTWKTSYIIDLEREHSNNERIPKDSDHYFSVNELDFIHHPQTLHKVRSTGVQTNIGTKGDKFFGPFANYKLCTPSKRMDVLSAVTTFMKISWVRQRGEQRHALRRVWSTGELSDTPFHFSLPPSTKKTNKEKVITGTCDMIQPCISRGTWSCTSLNLLKKRRKLRDCKQESPLDLPSSSDSEDEDIDEAFSIAEEEVSANKGKSTKRTARILWDLIKTKMMKHDRIKMFQDVVTQNYVAALSQRSLALPQTLLDQHPMDVSQEFVNVSRKLFLAITADDIAMYAASRGTKWPRQIRAVLEFSEDLRKLVVTEVTKKCGQGYAGAIKFFIQVAVFLLFTHHDLQMTLTVLRGLTSLQLYHLTSNWFSLFAEDHSTFCNFLALKAFLSPVSSRKAIASRTRTFMVRKKPFIPSLEHLLEHFLLKISTEDRRIIEEKHQRKRLRMSEIVTKDQLAFDDIISKKLQRIRPTKPTVQGTKVQRKELHDRLLALNDKSLQSSTMEDKTQAAKTGRARYPSKPSKPHITSPEDKTLAERTDQPRIPKENSKRQIIPAEVKTLAERTDQISNLKEHSGLQAFSAGEKTQTERTDQSLFPKEHSRRQVISAEDKTYAEQPDKPRNLMEHTKRRVTFDVPDDQESRSTDEIQTRRRETKQRGKANYIRPVTENKLVISEEAQFLDNETDQEEKYRANRPEFLIKDDVPVIKRTPLIEYFCLSKSRDIIQEAMAEASTADRKKRRRKGKKREESPSEKRKSVSKKEKNKVKADRKGRRDSKKKKTKSKEKDAVPGSKSKTLSWFKKRTIWKKTKTAIKHVKDLEKDIDDITEMISGFKNIFEWEAKDSTKEEHNIYNTVRSPYTVYAEELTSRSRPGSKRADQTDPLSMSQTERRQSYVPSIVTGQRRESMFDKAKDNRPSEEDEWKTFERLTDRKLNQLRRKGSVVLDLLSEENVKDDEKSAKKGRRTDNSNDSPDISKMTDQSSNFLDTAKKIKGKKTDQSNNSLILFKNITARNIDQSNNSFDTLKRTPNKTDHRKNSLDLFRRTKKKWKDQGNNSLDLPKRFTTKNAKQSNSSLDISKKNTMKETERSNNSPERSNRTKTKRKDQSNNPRDVSKWTATKETVQWNNPWDISKRTSAKKTDQSNNPRAVSQSIATNETEQSIKSRNISKRKTAKETEQSNNAWDMSRRTTSKDIKQSNNPPDASKRSTTKETTQSSNPRDISVRTTTKEREQSNNHWDISKRTTTKETEQSSNPLDISKRSTTKETDQSSNPRDISKSTTTKETEQINNPLDLSKRTTTKNTKQSNSHIDISMWTTTEEADQSNNSLDNSMRTPKKTFQRNTSLDISQKTMTKKTDQSGSSHDLSETKTKKKKILGIFNNTKRKRAKVHDDMTYDVFLFHQRLTSIKCPVCDDSECVYGLNIAETFNVIQTKLLSMKPQSSRRTKDYLKCTQTVNKFLSELDMLNVSLYPK